MNKKHIILIIVIVVIIAGLMWYKSHVKKQKGSHGKPNIKDPTIPENDEFDY